MTRVPYYSDSGIEVFCGDALAVMPSIKEAALVLTDPPYNVGVVYGQGTDDDRDDYTSWCAEWLAECRRLAPVVALTPGVANVGLWHRLGDDPDWIMAWHKPAAMGRCWTGFNNWEPVLLWGRPPSAVADVVTAPLIPDAEIDQHPCPKPLKWATSLVGALSRPNDLVLDPFMGSGTTMRAARDMGRRYIGIEIEERYCEMAVKRLAQGVLAVAA